MIHEMMRDFIKGNMRPLVSAAGFLSKMPPPVSRNLPIVNKTGCEDLRDFKEFFAYNFDKIENNFFFQI